jgi:hypothetical protein
MALCLFISRRLLEFMQFREMGSCFIGALS